jgi:hypothetical protein
MTWGEAAKANPSIARLWQELCSDGKPSHAQEISSDAEEVCKQSAPAVEFWDSIAAMMYRLCINQACKVFGMCCSNGIGLLLTARCYWIKAVVLWIPVQTRQHLLTHRIVSLLHCDNLNYRLHRSFLFETQPD